ncbi:hypothetical protein [Lentzea sp.]|uniref:hypothetical protein n=1 Tax=Lentzea sp. TaxID=56099 RepID=UPI002BE77969|nr:hypothetical protein [Lentzea sp.]HUQ59977.1 hypothetical protein [Lentzea sp.]
MGRVLGALAVALLSCGACGSSDEPVPEPTHQAAPCQVEENVPEPVQRFAGQPTEGGGPDVAPHHVENNRWKQRAPLGVEATAKGRDVVARVSPVLKRVCESGDFSADTTGKALAELQPQVEQPYPDQRFLGFTITLEGGTCVLGDLKPGLVRIFVDGTNGEGGCYTPKTH